MNFVRSLPWLLLAACAASCSWGLQLVGDEESATLGGAGGVAGNGDGDGVPGDGDGDGDESQASGGSSSMGGGGGQGGACGEPGFDLCDSKDNDCDGDIDEDCPGDIPVTSGLVLWLDAADASTYDLGTTVAEWRDKSGEENHATQMLGAQEPRIRVGGLNGRNVLRFDGADDSLIIDNMDGSFDADPFTIMFVATPRWTSDPGGNPSPLAVRGENSGLTRISLHLAWDLTNFHSFNGTVQVFSETPLSPRTPYFFDYSWGGVEDHFLNGVQQSTQAHALGAPTLQTVRVGAAQDNLEHFDGDIAEIIVFNRGLFPAERDQVEAHIESKWGIDTSP